MRPASNVDGDAKSEPTVFSPFRLGSPLTSLIYVPNLAALQRLHHLDRSSFKFHDQPNNSICGELYQHCTPRLRQRP